ncbi:porphobilinogen deaminase [Deferribacter desulfuricans SSM1]|uniref:Porphobilinogen deaminase n=1 Tax=Deferribacter desulfuricans (strain DSM 14783 / JCM 11476 / NBRC 101012 / SSM1) TaxID=639282 RepID=D3PCG5_DEFDS|nr:hydroxymethylbilane synthase [Deferribacter desulfuricans]BAI80288.1 porphobilinogen deaminase [Deferribacter desulfuricans SSM1]
MNKLVIGTRGSKLALWQANHIKSLIESTHHIDVELKIIKTTGDKILDTPLAKIGGKGLFVKEIEEELLNKNVDIAVHSMKDVPVELPDGLEVGVFPVREEPYDAFLSVKYNSLDELPDGAVIGTSSLRRKIQLMRKYPHLVIKDLRGNVDTRIRKLTEGQYDAIILAKAGLKRLGLLEHVKQTIDDTLMIPAVCQGTLGIEYREDDQDVQKVIGFLNHEETVFRTKAERAFLKRLEGGCQVPLGCIANLVGDRLILKGFLANLDGSKYIYEEIEGDKTDAVKLGLKLAKNILGQGGKEIIKEIYE